MCDYSLEHVQSRAAKVGDRLVATLFKNTITRGFSAVGEPEVAVCLLPGTELAFDQAIEIDHALGFFPRKNLGETTAVFRHINDNRPHEHHDALELPSGRTILLTRLCLNQTATVLQLPMTEQPASPEPVVEVQEQPEPVA